MVINNIRVILQLVMCTFNIKRGSLRDSVNKLVFHFPRTNYVKNSFSFSGATLWNSYPVTLESLLH